MLIVNLLIIFFNVKALIKNGKRKLLKTTDNFNKYENNTIRRASLRIILLGKKLIYHCSEIQYIHHQLTSSEMPPPLLISFSILVIIPTVISIYNFLKNTTINCETPRKNMKYLRTI